MEDQIIGAVFIIAVLAFVGFGSNIPKRKYGENFPGAKYSKAKKG